MVRSAIPRGLSRDPHVPIILKIRYETSPLLVILSLPLICGFQFKGETTSNAGLSKGSHPAS